MKALDAFLFACFAAPVIWLLLSVISDLRFQRRLDRLARAERERRAAEIAEAKRS